MAALEVRGELHLVHRDKGDVDVFRHRLDGRDPVARVLRADFFFAGNERDVVRAHPRDTTLIDLACEQPQRKSDQSARMREHAVDREMRLAGIGRPEHGGDAAPAARGVGEGCGRSFQQRSKPDFCANCTVSLQFESDSPDSLNGWNELGTNRVRITDSGGFLAAFTPHVVLPLRIITRIRPSLSLSAFCEAAES